MKIQKAFVVKIVAKRRRKLASYEAGVLNQNNLARDEGIYFSSVPSGRDDLRATFQPLRSWLISGAPSEQKKAVQELFRAGHKLTPGIGFQVK